MNVKETVVFLVGFLIAIALIANWIVQTVENSHDEQRDIVQNTDTYSFEVVEKESHVIRYMLVRHKPTGCLYVTKSGYSNISPLLNPDGTPYCPEKEPNKVFDN